MPAAGRPFTLALAAVFALLLGACRSEVQKSNNDGKIEGRWKIISAPALNSEVLGQLDRQKKFYYVVEFVGEQVVIGPAWEDPERQRHLDKAKEELIVGCNYKLLKGDEVEVFNLTEDVQQKAGGLFGKEGDRVRVKIHIDGDTMTVTDGEGKSGTLRRLK